MKQVRLPVDHFKKVAKREYSDWETAIIREFIQNGVDAGSSRIDFSWNEKTLIVTNDGQPMDQNTCENVLLTLGGTNKTEYDVGGFAKAKEILYFPWERWEIRSSNYKVTGVGCYYEISPADPFHGVQSSIQLDYQISQDKFETFIRKCQTFANISLNGKAIPTGIPRGKRIRDLGWAILYKRKTLHGDPVSGNGIWVRSHGVPMFHVYTDTLDCVLHLELSGDTKSLMTSNRDGLKEPYRTELERIAREIMVNRKSALRDEDPVIIQTFSGYGNTHVRRKPTPPEPLSQDQAILINNPEILKEIEHSAAKSSQPLTDAIPSEYLPDVIGQESHPDILIHAKGFKKIPRKYNPHTWSYKVKAMLVLWNKILAQIFHDNDLSGTFGIGLVLDKDFEARFVSKNNLPHFLINPDTWKYGFKLSGKNKWLSIMEMKQKAVHEIAHFVSGSDHNEDFIRVLEGLEANTWKNDRAYKSLAKIKKLDFQVDELKSHL